MNDELGMNSKKNNIPKLFGSILLISVLFSIIMGVRAQQPPPRPSSAPARPMNPNIKIIELRQADILLKREESEAMVLKDNVILYHDGALMHCDSAYWFQHQNRFEAFSRVRINQGDTLFVNGDYMTYDGNIKIAKLRHNVRLEDKKATLFTDSLDFDRMQNLGYYFEGGMLVDDKNKLTSFWGQYNTINKDALFIDSVKLVNPEYTIHSEKLRYNTASKIADILGPSTIVSDSGTIHTSEGWYNTVTEESRLLNRSDVVSSDGTKTLIGDTIDYNRKTGIGKVQGNMKLHDTQRKAILYGNYGYYDDKKGYALARDSAYVIDYSQKDSLFLRGDTLEMTTDSTYRELKAMGKVRFYRNDIQGVSGLMHYVSKDSVLYMKNNPVIWNKNQQVMGDEIHVFMKDSVIDKALIKHFSFAIQQRPDTAQFNQLKGKDMTATFKDGNIRRVLVEGGAESLYYLLDEQNTIVGLNNLQGPVMRIGLSNDEIEDIRVIGEGKAVLTPIPQLQSEDKLLNGFLWLNELRPKNRYDIFRTETGKSASDAPKPKRFIRDEDVMR